MNLRRARALLSTSVVILLVLAIWPAGAQAATLKVRQISAGDNFTCAVTTDNNAWCWGFNFDNAVGDLTTTGQHRPVRVHKRTGGGLLGNVRSISAGSNGACAVLWTGDVWCWGLGYSNPPRSERGAYKVAGIGGVTQISVGNAVCARTRQGAGWCWGYNWDGEVGNGTQYTPAPLTRLFTRGVVSMQASSSHGCALKTDHSVWCWGVNGYGELGDGTQTQRLSPVRVKSAAGGFFSGATQIGHGHGEHQCALVGGRQVMCWGLDGVGQIGDGSTDTHRLRPVHVRLHGANFDRVTAVSTGYGHSCALRQNQTVWCWGWGEAGQLGSGGRPVAQVSPVKVVLAHGKFDNITSISVGQVHTCAISTDGSAWCWGSNYDGGLGDGTNRKDSTYPLKVRFPS